MVVVRAAGRRIGVIGVGVIALLVALSTPPASAQGAAPLPVDRERYELPADGGVLRAFEAPRSSFGPGHRGVDLELGVGGIVRAAAPGRVRHAGPVAGMSWVSIDHADGITTSYGPLNRIAVEVGTQVVRGQPLARLAAGGHGDGGTDRGLHWGARTAWGYLDPMSLLDAGIGRPSLIGAGGWRGSDHAVRGYAPWSGGRWGGWSTEPSPTADRPGYSVPPSGNHLVLLPGLGSTSATRVIDPDHLGYPLQQVTRFSYAGRHDHHPGELGPDRDQHGYGSIDTWPGAGPAAERLAAQLRAHARRHPGQAVDLLGHSMGGIVVLRYLLEHHDPYDPSLPPIGHIVTIASPVDGSDAATVGKAIDDGIVSGPIVRWLQARGHLGGDRVPLDAAAVEELAARSDAVQTLATQWLDAVEDGTAGPLAMGTRALFIGGSRDLIVSADRARAPDLDTWLGEPAGGMERFRERLADDRGQFGTLPPDPGVDRSLDPDQLVTERVLPGGHTSVLASEAVREVTWRFLAGDDLPDAPGRAATGPMSALADSVGIATELSSRMSPWNRLGRLARFRVPTTDPDRSGEHQGDDRPPATGGPDHE